MGAFLAARRGAFLGLALAAGRYHAGGLALPRMASVTPLLRTAWPVWWRVGVVLALFGLYLPLSGYMVGQFRFDAAEYWELSLRFTPQGHFSLLAFDAPHRGYLGPLLVLPARLLCHFTGWSMLAGARLLGAGWAALLFGLVIPELWKQATGRAFSGGRWLGLLSLGFIFWRDYFNFTLSDAPALALLGLGLAALMRRDWYWAGLGGLLLLAAVNIRPIYLASVPAGLWLLLRTAGSVRERGVRAAALLCGAGLVLLPQALINRRYFQRATPLVLAQRPGGGPIYLKQLGWGTRFQRYESSLIPAIPRSLVYADPGGQADLVGHQFTGYGHYLRFVAGHPLAVTGRCLKHLFNGLDLWYPTPYPTQLHPAGQWLLRLLNYGLLGVGTYLAGLAFWRARHRQAPYSPAAPVLGALLLPCLLVLPTLMECRFLLPLHLLLLTGIAATWQPIAGWRLLQPARRWVLLLLAAGWMCGCWQLSESTSRQRRPPSEAPQ